MFTVSELETMHARALSSGLSDFEAWGCAMTAQADSQLTGAFDLPRIVAECIAERPVRAGLAAKWAAVQGDTTVIFDDGWSEMGETEAAWCDERCPACLVAGEDCYDTEPWLYGDDE